MSAARTLDRLFRSNYAVIVFIGLIGWTWLLLSYNSLEHSLYRPVIRVVKDTGEVSCKVSTVSVSRFWADYGIPAPALP